MANKLVVSLSPHVHSGDSVQKNMYWVCIALVPALLVHQLWCGCYHNHSHIRGCVCVLRVGHQQVHAEEPKDYRY